MRLRGTIRRGDPCGRPFDSCRRPQCPPRGVAGAGGDKPRPYGLVQALAWWLAVCASTFAVGGEPSHGFAYFGNLKYPKDMAHFDYANPDAPKGGVIRMPGIGSFNNLNPYVDKGILPYFMDPRLGSAIYDPLMKASEDELASYYGVLAESVEVADDFGWVTYTLRDNAYWHDGVPVTVDDVLWTFDMLKTEASISWRSGYREIVALERVGPRSFKFVFSEDAEKTPHLIVQTTGFTTLPKHYWENRDFGATTLEPPLGNGAYRIGRMEPGHRIAFERVEDHWARDLNVSVGHYNFDRFEVIYFFDENVMLQAMRAGVFDYYRDQNEATWATAYDFEAYRQGLFRKEAYTMGPSYGMHYGVVLNTRRELFKDIRIREALTLAYNFEWANRVYWHDGMARNDSYFMLSGMQAEGLPGEAELELLEPFRGRVPERVFTHPVELPKNRSFGRNREELKRAHALLVDAGWVVRDFVRVNEETGEPLTFEFAVSSIAHERMLVPFVDNLKRLGIQAVLRRMENNLMINRLRTYDFDTTIRKFYTFKIPQPARLRSQFTSRYADPPNMTNYAGIKDPVVDHLVEKVIAATTEEEMNVAGQALDRVLLWSFYLIPEGYPIGRKIVYWDRFGHPPLGVEHMNWTGFPHLWWIDAAKSARVDAWLAGHDE